MYSQIVAKSRMKFSPRNSSIEDRVYFFPPPGFFDSCLPSFPAPSHEEGTNNTIDYTEDALTDKDRQAEEKEQSRREREEELYDKLDETQPIQVEDGYVTFCRHFKYLGSFISFGLCDDYDIEK